MKESDVRPELSAQAPVVGTFQRVVDAGIEVALEDGERAFCPLSQIVDSGRVDDPESWLGKETRFLVSHARRREEHPSGGAMTVVSRRAWLRREREENRSSLAERLEVGDVVRGQIANIMPYGVFIDIGGWDALVDDWEEEKEEGDDVWVVVESIEKGEDDNPLSTLEEGAITIQMCEVRRATPDEIPDD